MHTKGLTLKDQNWINSKCRGIAKLERHGVREDYLRRELYMLGLFAFRQFHKAGMAEATSPMDRRRSIGQVRFRE